MTEHEAPGESPSGGFQRRTDLKYLALVALFTVCTGAVVLVYGWDPIHTYLILPHPDKLLVDLEAFDGGWTKGESWSPRGALLTFNGAAMAAGQNYAPPSIEGDPAYSAGPARHYVAIFASETRAHDNYLELVRSHKPATTNDPKHTWPDPHLGEADESSIRCLHDGDPPSSLSKCVTIARYGKYVSVFWVAAEISDTTWTDLARLFEAVDINFAQIE